ncbi:hypothetical protein [Photobacterium leiognathi]|uniref:hypothetical protein n=1 Tax=Photobacterium leiognathi TaxID=553611 RepID=UPI002981EB66|nr:hypothetical protein [Photobacterium leiognathi]
MKNYYLALLLSIFTLTGCLTEKTPEQTASVTENENDTANSVQPPIFFPVDDANDDTTDSSDNTDNETEITEGEQSDQEDKENFQTLDVADNVNFSANIRTIPVNVTNPVTNDVYVNIYRHYTLDDNGAYIVSYDDRIIATAVTESGYQGQLYLTPDITQLLVEIIDLDNNSVILQQTLETPINGVDL